VGKRKNLKKTLGEVNILQTNEGPKGGIGRELQVAGETRKPA